MNKFYRSSTAKSGLRPLTEKKFAPAHMETLVWIPYWFFQHSAKRKKEKIIW